MPDHAQTENLSQKRLATGSKNGGAGAGQNPGTATEGMNRSFSNQAGVTNGSLSTSNGATGAAIGTPGAQS